jgi:uncharacterized protein YegL
MQSITLLIIDESGSMGGMEDFVQETYNGIIQEMILELTEFPELNQFIEVWTFEGRNINQRLPFMEISPQLIPTKLKYQPLGNTPLFDAMGRALEGMQSRIDNIPNLAEAQVNVGIITDGVENSSRDYSGSQIKQLVSNLTEMNWKFSYYGTEHDVDKIAERLSIKNRVRFSKDSTGFQTLRKSYVSESKMHKSAFIKLKE